MDFRLWANVKVAGTGRFHVTVSAVSVEDPDRTGGVETGEADSLEQARALRDDLVGRMSSRLEARGHRIVQVRTD